MFSFLVGFASMENPPVTQTGGLSAGAIVGAVFGFIALFTIFAVLVYFILKPPTDTVKGVVTGTAPTPANETVSFDNPLTQQDIQPKAP